MAVSTTESVKKKSVTKETETNRYPDWLGEERVEMFVVDQNGDGEPVVGCINGYNWVVPVDETVSVPLPIAEIIRQSRRTIEESKKRNKAFAEGKEKIG